MKKFLAILFLAVIFYQCKKTDGDLSGKEYIRGRLFLNDTLTQQAENLPLGKKRVSIGYTSSDTLNFLFSTTTDDNGYFIFPNLKKEISYRIYYEDTTSGVIHEAIDTIYAPTDTARLIAHVSLKRQNGIHVTVTDPNGGILSNANVCLFNSSVAIGYANNNCDGSNYKLSSDAAGHAFKFLMPASIYYINSSLTVGGISFFSKDTVQIEDNIKFDTIKLKIPNGMQFTVFDSLGTRMSGVSICVFTSLALYQQFQCFGSNFQLNSDLNAEASRYNLVSNTYYIYSTFVDGSFVWEAKDTMYITDQIVHDSLYMRKKQ